MLNTKQNVFLTYQIGYYTSIIISSISLTSIIYACTAEKQPSVKVQGKV